MHAPARPLPGTPPVRVNLFSDTQTRPTVAMKAAMLEAELGDEQHGDDPTVNALCDRVAALLGKEAALFLPSGTMCNVVAIRTHCRAGDEVLAHRTAHILESEGGAHAALSGVQILTLDGPRGQFDPETVRAAIRPRSRYEPSQRLLAVEQTANSGGGSVWPLTRLEAVAAVARAQGWATHMDGARLLNASIAADVPAARMAARFDSVWIDFTKGLGAPLGAVLAGPAEFIDAAWRWKQRLGGALRQAGICAAACLHALDHHVARLAEDHALARVLAEGLGRLPGLAVEPPETNLVFADPAGTGLDAEEIAARLARRGVLVSVAGHRLRACTHLDVTPALVEEALAAFAAELAARRPA